MEIIYSARDIRMFHATVTIWHGELEQTNSWFYYHAYQQIHSKQMEILFFFYYYIHFFFKIGALYEHV